MNSKAFQDVERDRAEQEAKAAPRIVDGLRFRADIPESEINERVRLRREYDNAGTPREKTKARIACAEWDRAHPHVFVPREERLPPAKDLWYAPEERFVRALDSQIAAECHRREAAKNPRPGWGWDPLKLFH